MGSRIFRWLRSLYSLRVLGVAIALFFAFTLTGCGITPVKAEDRIFRNLSLDFLGEYRLPKMQFAETTVGGLSGIVYDRQRDRFYAISDDRSEYNPARFYTLKLKLEPSATLPDSLIQSVEVEKVTLLKDANGKPFAKGTLDPEGIALTPRHSLFISSEGVSRDGVNPFVNEFDLETGQQRSALSIPKRFLPKPDEMLGIRDNQGFESLTLSAVGFASGQQLEPFRLFTATESAIAQDLPPNFPPDSLPPVSAPVRFLHYLIGEENSASMLISEHIYLLDQPPPETKNNGLTEMLVLDQGGHFLSLERSFGAAGFGAKLFQMATGGANDTSTFDAFQGNIGGVTPIYKEPLLDLAELGIPLDNLEGMTLGPQLPDGTQTLLLVSDDNFNDLQTTQFLLFRLRGNSIQ
ncbi:MAG: esterase-like activity of phytase family protein [Timaviella obliquedivisa GSE-PSE-MK23-08B]|nr:esterase-like activity of phytase family protein [Timaviella obliquedivisa GSE-PSE-MK23-08B]